MKGLFYIFLLVILLPVFLFCSDVQSGSKNGTQVIIQLHMEDEAVKESALKFGEERLVAKDVGRGGDAHSGLPSV